LIDRRVLLSSVENIRVAFQDKFTAFDRESTITRLWHDIAGGTHSRPRVAALSHGAHGWLTFRLRCA
jgi:hypothetical protein